jgi:hypothetical protein
MFYCYQHNGIDSNEYNTQCFRRYLAKRIYVQLTVRKRVDRIGYESCLIKGCSISFLKAFGFYYHWFVLGSTMDEKWRYLNKLYTKLPSNNDKATTGILRTITKSTHQPQPDSYLTQIQAIYSPMEYFLHHISKPILWVNSHYYIPH